MSKKTTQTQAEIDAINAAAKVIANAAAKPAAGVPAGVIKARPSSFAYADPKSIVRRPGFNPRFEFGEIADLARSIRLQATEHKVPGGLLMPLRVAKTETGFELIDGDRRLTAVESLLEAYAAGNLEQGYNFPDGIPVTIVDKGQTEIASLLQMFEANTGKPFLPLEEAAAYKRMRDAGMTLEQIASSVQRNHLHVVKTLALLEADDSLKEAVASGEIGGTIAKDIAVVAKGDKAKQKELVEEAKKATAEKKKGGKPTGSMAKVKAKIEEQRQAKAAAKGKVLKVRVLSADQLDALGLKASKHLQARVEEAGLVANAEADLLEWIKSDANLAAAFQFGVLQALKAAGGIKNVSLEA